MKSIEKVLATEYIRLCDKERDCFVEWEHIPSGSIQTKRIKGKEYYYRQYREKSKVKSVYIKKSDVDQIAAQIERRKILESELLAVRERKVAIETIIGRDVLSVSVVKLIVANVAKQYPEITRIILFGSRAGQDYRDDSDVDLLFESAVPVSLMRQNEIRIKLEEKFGVSVDLVHGPLKKNNFLQAEKQIEVYEAQR